MKNNAWAILQVPININAQTTDEDTAITDTHERERRFGQYDHVRLHGQDYPKRLQQAGFSVEKFSVKENFTTQQIAKMRLDKNEILYIARKIDKIENNDKVKD
jgi:hypothetical protein